WYPLAWRASGRRGRLGGRSPQGRTWAQLRHGGPLNRPLANLLQSPTISRFVGGRIMPDTLPMTDAVLLRRDQDHVAWLTLNRPAARNALSRGLMTALEQALDGIGADQSVRVVVIGSAGPAFCAGHD